MTDTCDKCGRKCTSWGVNPALCYECAMEQQTKKNKCRTCKGYVHLVYAGFCNDCYNKFKSEIDAVCEECRSESVPHCDDCVNYEGEPNGL